MSTKHSRLHECSVCKKTYSRQEHLNRHSSSHTSFCPFVCSQCGTRFKRSDILKRHQRSCDGTAPKVLASAWSGGLDNARRRACNTCVKQKRQCNLEWPCSNCAKHNRSCEYPERVRVFEPDDPELVTSTDKSSSNDANTKSPNHPGRLASVSSDNSTQDFNLPHSKPATSSARKRLSKARKRCVARQRITRPRLLVLQQDPVDSFSFLVTFTRNEGIVPVFESDAVLKMLRQATATVLEQVQESRGRNHATTTYSETIDSLQRQTTKKIPQIENCYSQSIPGLELVESSSMDQLFVTGDLWADDPLASQSLGLVLALRDIVFEDSLGQPVTLNWSDEIESRCANFFSPSKVRIFLEAYWSIWSPHWPALHRPTFDPSATPINLLAALVVVGACHSPNPVDRRDAEFWYDFVEELVFRDLDLCVLVWECDDAQPYDRVAQRRMVQAIQAAYAVCVYQNWNGTDVARNRTRRERWSSIVTACRSFGFHRARHDDMEFTTPSAFDWYGFIANEEAIRTLQWVFLVDVAFTMFHNMPPRVKLNELKMGLASGEVCFQAQTATECLSYFQEWSSRAGRHKNASLSSLITLFCTSDLDGAVLHALSYEAFVNLWCVVCSFHVMLFYLELSPDPKPRFLPIRTGLSSWKTVWNQRFRNLDEQFFDVAITQQISKERKEKDSRPQPVLIDESSLWKRLGFWKYAPEFWLLAYVQLEQIQYSNSGIKGLKDEHSQDEAALMRLKSFIEHFQDARFC